MLTKKLTCYTYLKVCGNHKVAARLDTADPQKVNAIITETSETCKGMFGEDIKLHDDQHYLVGEIADRLYAYEQLGYSPEELQKIIAEHESLEKVQKAVEDVKKRALYMTTARANDKSLWDAYRTQLLFYGSMANDVALVPSMHHPTTIATDKSFQIENVIFNEPATIVFWKDGTKTVVKATNEEFDPEKGLAMAIAKKALGNKHDYYNVFKRWLKKGKRNTRLIFRVKEETTNG